VERGALARAGLGPEKSSVGEIESGQATRRRDLGATFLPVESAGDHQVEDQPEVIVEAYADAFAEAAEMANRFAFRASERRVRGAQQKWAGDAYSFEALPENALLERFEVNDDVGKLGHLVDRAGTLRLSYIEAGELPPLQEAWSAMDGT